MYLSYQLEHKHSIDRMQFQSSQNSQFLQIFVHGGVQYILANGVLCPIQVQQPQFQVQQHQQQYIYQPPISRYNVSSARLDRHIGSIFSNTGGVIYVNWPHGTLVEYAARHGGGCDISHGGVTGWLPEPPSFAM